MKTQILFTIVTVLIGMGTAHAIPVVNENAANSGMITIYPDHQDPHHFYIAPNVVVFARSADGSPVFSYIEYQKKIFKTEAYITMTLIPAYTQTELERVKLDILDKDPQAQFSGVPFVESSLALGGVLNELFKESACDHKAGLIGQEQSCTMRLSKVGRRAFLKALKNKALFVTLQFEYSIEAVVRHPDGSFTPRVVTHGVAARIDGDQLARYPQVLFLR